MYSVPCAYKSANLITDAGVAELADAQASGACGSNIVWVQVPSPASFFYSFLGFFGIAGIYFYELQEFPKKVLTFSTYYCIVLLVFART